jgi:hypothetical protein
MAQDFGSDPRNWGPEDPEVRKFRGQTVLMPMEEGQVYGDMKASEAAGILKSKLIIALGAENYKLFILGLQALGALFAAYVVYKVFSLIRERMDDPVARRLKEIEEKEKERELAAKSNLNNNNNNKNSKKNSNQEKLELIQQAQKETAQKQQEEQENSAAAASASSFNFPQCKRTRVPTLSKPTSQRKGFDLVSVCKNSPDANIVIVAERAKRTLSVFAQHKNFVSSFKTTLNVATPLDTFVTQPPLITSASFSPDSRYLCLYDVALQSLIVVRNDTTEATDHNEFAKTSSMAPLYSLKVSDAKGLLAPPKGVNWGNQFSHYFPVPAPDRLFFFHNDGCMMIFDGRDGTKLAAAKKSLGNHVAWGVAADGVVACSGSMMSETVLYNIKTREGSSNSVSIDRVGGTSLSPSNKKLSHVILTPDAKVLLMLPEDSSTFVISFLYEVNIENGDAPKIAVELTDNDFLDPSLRSKLQIDVTHFAPNPLHPDKHGTFLALAIGGDVVVYRIDSFEANPQIMGRTSGKVKQPGIHRVLELHGSHGNDSSLMGTAICGRGRGLMTAAESDSKKSLSVWELDNRA